MRFLGWPGLTRLLEAWCLSLLNFVWFVLVYGGCDRLTARRTLRVPVHVPAELTIPLVPWTIVLYMSIYLLFILGPFVLRERAEFRALIGTLASIILVAGICFLLLPASLAFPSPADGELGIWAPLFHLADRANLDYNLAPSLHVALSVACVAAFARHARGIGKGLLWAWAAAIAVSTVLTHQHHLLDVAGGWLLAILAPRGIPLLQGAAPTWRRAQVGDP
ncbi:MAG TPA: phosphatase PAP2 family protein [Candidatus Polarisedimenticolaceae bacterium]|nr:phosphatase PAP2 family protein [Candidatus Polarisedimenticolaceae bacterium]